MLTVAEAQAVNGVLECLLTFAAGVPADAAYDAGLLADRAHEKLGCGLTADAFMGRYGTARRPSVGDPAVEHVPVAGDLL